MKIMSRELTPTKVSFFELMAWVAFFSVSLGLSLREHTFATRYFDLNLSGDQSNVLLGFWLRAILVGAFRSTILVCVMRIVRIGSQFEPGEWLLINSFLMIVSQAAIGLYSNFESNIWGSKWSETSIVLSAIVAALLFTIAALYCWNQENRLWGFLFGLLAIVLYALSTSYRLEISNVLIEQGGYVRIAFMVLLAAVCILDFTKMRSRGFFHWVGVCVFMIGFA